jgi:hypothetical protein
MRSLEHDCTNTTSIKIYGIPTGSSDVNHVISIRMCARRPQGKTLTVRAAQERGFTNCKRRARQRINIASSPTHRMSICYKLTTVDRQRWREKESWRVFDRQRWREKESWRVGSLTEAAGRRSDDSGSGSSSSMISRSAVLALVVSWL